MISILIELLADDAGATSIEYAMIASAVSIVIAAVVFGMGDTLSGVFTNVSDGFS